MKTMKTKKVRMKTYSIGDEIYVFLAEWYDVPEKKRPKLYKPITTVKHHGRKGYSVDEGIEFIRIEDDEEDR